MLSLSERQFRLECRRYESDGVEGFVHLALQPAGLVANAKGRGAHRRKPERKPLIGVSLLP